MIKRSYYYDELQKWIDCEIVGLNPLTIRYISPDTKAEVIRHVSPESVKSLHSAGDNMS